MNENASQQDKILAAKVTDAVLLARDRYSNKFIGFLDEHQATVAVNTLRPLQYTNYKLFGGHEGASRVFLGIISPYEKPEDELFPIRPVTFTYREVDCPTHRDFLGALMNLMITRDSIGDILVGLGHTVVFLTENAAQLVLNELQKVGSTGVKVSQGIGAELPCNDNFLAIEGSIASLRLDCIIALVTKLSREKAVKLITDGLVSINFQLTGNISYNVAAGDKISIRGYGRYIFDGMSATTKKGRAYVTARKYI